MILEPFIKTCIACNVGILASYPLDTLKTRNITNNTDIGLYCGIEAPLLLGGITNGIRFHIFNMLKSQSLLMALLVAGSVNGFFFIPYELYKLSRQTRRKYITLKGSNIIFIKEILGTFIQFYLYNTLETNSPILNIIYGGASSAIAMSVVHPLDVIYANYMLNNFTILYTLEKVDIWVGYKYNLLKTFIGYGLTMSIISSIK